MKVVFLSQGLTLAKINDVSSLAASEHCLGAAFYLTKLRRCSTMYDGKFEWDDVKAASNLAKHGISFEDAALAFSDPFAIDFYDMRFDYDEERSNLYGMVEGRLLVVSYTMRDDVIRIISARGAESHEQRQYHEENSEGS